MDFQKPDTTTTSLVGLIDKLDFSAKKQIQKLNSNPGQNNDG